MNELYLEHLDRSGLIQGDQVNIEKLKSASVTELLDIAGSLTESAKSDLFDPQESVFANWATASLSGGPQECQSLPCRLNRAEQLARYAVLYSDRVFVHNEFGDYVAHPPKEDSDSISRFRKAFAGDLAIVARIRPVIEAGRVVPVTQAKYYCRHCLVKHSFGDHATRRFDVLEKKLTRDFYDKTELDFGPFHDRYAMIMSGPEELLAHGKRHWIRDDLPPPLASSPRLRARIESGQRIALSDSMRRRLGVHKQVAAGVWRDIMYELTMSHLLGTTFLTENPLHVKLLSALTANVDMERRNLAASELLTSHVPFIADVSIRDLLVLREREQESFIAFRSALSSAIDSYRTEHSTFGDREARQLYSDVLAPRLAALDRKVTVAKSDLVRSVVTTAIGWTGAISFGIYSGMLPPQVVAALAAAGTVKIAAETIVNTLKPRLDSAVRTDDMYFLWRAKKLTK